MEDVSKNLNAKDLSIEQEKQQITEIVIMIFHALGFTVKPLFKQVLTGQDVEFTFTIEVGDDAQYLIGHHGGNLRSLEHLSHIAARQKGLKMRFKIDINGYREERRRMFQKIASQAVDEVRQCKEAVVLRPMTPYERRIIHAFVVDIDGVSTDSIGDGLDRKVVVKPQSIVE